MQNSRIISTPIIVLFFFGSGFAALLYQVVWLKYLNLLFGNTTYATAAVLSAFMFGLSIGSWLSVRISHFRNSLRTYGMLEIGIGAFAAFFPMIYSGLSVPFSWVFNVVGPQSFWYNLITFAIAFVVLSIPTSLMGATLPILSDVIIHDRKIAPKAGLLYCINTAGAVAGILVSAFWFIPALGLRATVSLGVLLNLLIGICCFWGGRDFLVNRPLTEARKDTKELLIYLYAVSGLLALGYELLWTRILVLHLGSSVYAYAIMLAVFLLGISIGSFLAGRLIKNGEPTKWFGWIQVFWAFSILLQIIQFQKFGDGLVVMTRPFTELTITTQFVIFFLVSFQALFLPTVASGALFPVVVEKLWRGALSVKSSVSKAYSYNTVGAIAGSLVAGFILVPWLGTQKALICLAAGNLLLGMIALVQSGSRKLPLLGIGCVFVALAVNLGSLNLLASAGIFEMNEKERLISMEEDLTGTISVERRNYFGIPYDSLSVNGVNVAGTSPNLIIIQKLQGHIPMIISGPKKVKRVLHIGFGSGGTAYAASLYPNTSITVVELSRAIVRNAAHHFLSVNHGIVQSGKLRFIYFDGRSYVQNTREKYDVILSDSIHPRYSGNGSLYTKDYYQMVYHRLNDKGVHSQWIPLYSLSQKNLREILKAFTDIFPQTYVWYPNSTINPFLVVTGQKTSSPIRFSAFEEALRIKEVKEDLEKIGVFESYALLDYFLFGNSGVQKYVAGVEPHNDDTMTVEYESSRIQDRQGSWWLNFRDVLQQREQIRRYVSQERAFDYTRLMLYEEATGYNLQGQLHFIGNRTTEAKQFFRVAQQKNPADREPFEFYYVGF